jgi:ankyrin repeat protein
MVDKMQTNGTVSDATIVFVDACLSADLDVMKQILIQEGANIPTHIIDQSHALQLAVAKGDLDLVTLLVQKGADVNKKFENDMTVLHAASMSNFDEIAEFLIQNGANIDVKATLNVSDEKLVGATPLSFAVNSLNLMKMFIQYGADVNARVKRVQEPHYEEGTILFSLIGTGKVDAMKYLADHGADLNALVTTSRGSTHSLLYHSLLEGDADATEILLNKNVDPNTGSESDTGFTSTLHEALMQKKYGFVQLLLSRSANVNSSLNVENDKYELKGGTALHFAAKYCASPEWTKLFIRHCARVDAVDTYGHTPLYYARSVGNEAVVNALLEAGATN